MAGFTKLFSNILTSTIWRESTPTRIVWITMLALKDRNHIVEATLPGLAHLAGVTLDECAEAIRVLSSPDPHSRTKDHEGRRIEAIDGGWFILNGAKYRDQVSDDHVAALTRERVRRFREQSALRNVTKRYTASVSESEEGKSLREPLRHHTQFAPPTDAEAQLYASKLGLPDVQLRMWRAHYDMVGWKVGSRIMKSWQSSMTKWKLRWETERRPMIKPNSDTVPITQSSRIGDQLSIASQQALRIT